MPRYDLSRIWQAAPTCHLAAQTCHVASPGAPPWRDHCGSFAATLNSFDRLLFDHHHQNSDCISICSMKFQRTFFVLKRLWIRAFQVKNLRIVDSAVNEWSSFCPFHRSLSNCRLCFANWVVQLLRLASQELQEILLNRFCVSRGGFVSGSDSFWTGNFSSRLQNSCSHLELLGFGDWGLRIRFSWNSFCVVLAGETRNFFRAVAGDFWGVGFLSN